MYFRAMFATAVLLGAWIGLGAPGLQKADRIESAAAPDLANATVDECIKRVTHYAVPCPSALDTPAKRALFRRKYRERLARLEKINPHFNSDAALDAFNKTMENVDSKGRYHDPRPDALDRARAEHGRQEEPSLDVNQDALERIREQYEQGLKQEEPPVE